MPSPVFIIILFIVLGLSMSLTKWLSIVLAKKGIMDVPNQRSSHQTPTPRGGGLAIIKSIVAGMVLLYLFTDVSLPGPLFWTGFILVAATGFLDDKINLPVYARFLLQLIAASLIYYETGGFQVFPLPEPYTFPLGIFNYPLTVFWTLAVINIFNFLDGIDGFAGVQSILAGAGMALLDWQGTGFVMGLLIVFATMGFLRYNWHPAKIFMGDIGSASLGYIFATLPFYTTSQSGNFSVYAMGIFLWFFLSDGAFTILRRLLKGERIWEAHRSHLYQQLTIAGYNHQQVVFRVMGAAAILVILFFAFFHYLKMPLLALPLAVLSYIGYFFYVKQVSRQGTDE